MKKMKFILMTIFTSFMLGIYFIGQIPSSKAATGNQLDVEFIAYKNTKDIDFLVYFESDLNSYFNYIFNDSDALAELSSVSGSPTTKKDIIKSGKFSKEQFLAIENYGVWGDIEALASNADSSKSLEEYWGTIDEVFNSDVTWNVAGSNKNPTMEAFTSYGGRRDSISSITSVSKGDTFYLAAKITGGRTIDNATIGINMIEWLEGYGMNNTQAKAYAGKYSETENGTLSKKNFSIKKNNYENALSYITGVTKVGFTHAGQLAQYDDYICGYLELKVSDSFSKESVTFDLSRTGNSTWGCNGEIKGSIDGTKSQYWGTITPLTIKIKGESSNTTNIAQPTITSDSLGNNVSLNETSSGKYSLPDSKKVAVDEEITLGLSGLDGATISQVKYSTTSETAAQNGTSLTTSGEKYKLDLQTAGIPAGQTIYIAVEVTAEDKNTKIWKYITLPVAPSSEVELTGFTITNTSPGGGYTTNQGDQYSPTKNNYTISIAGDATSITFSFTYKGASAILKSPSESDYTISSGSTKTYTTGTIQGSYSLEITAADGITKKTYTFNVGFLGTDGSANLEFNDGNKTIPVDADNSKTTFNVYGFQYNTQTISSITATKNGSGKIVSINGQNNSSLSNVAWNNQIIVVTEDASGITHTLEYNLHYEDVLNSITFMNGSNAVSLDKSFEPGTLTYTMNLPTSVTSLDVTAVSNGSISINSATFTTNVKNTLNIISNNIITVVITDSNDTSHTKTYTFNITKTSEDGTPTKTTFTNGTETITINASDFTITGKNGSVTVNGFKQNVNFTNITVTAPTGATIKSIDGSTKTSTSATHNNITVPSDVTVIITDASGNDHTYTYTLVKEDHITDITVTGDSITVDSFAVDDFAYDVIVPNKTITLTVTPTGQGKITVAGKTVASGTSTTVKADAGSFEVKVGNYTYKYTIKSANVEIEIQEIYSYDDKNEASLSLPSPTLSSTSKTYTINDSFDYTITQIRVKFVFKEKGQSATAEGNNYSYQTSYYKVSKNFTSTSQETITLTITVKAESGDTFDYKFVSTRKAADSDKSYTLDLNVGSNNFTSSMTEGQKLPFAEKAANFTVTATKTTTKIDLVSITSNGSKFKTMSSKTSISGKRQDISLSETATSDASIKYTIKIKITSQDGVSEEKDIYIYIEKPSDYRTLSIRELKVNGITKTPTSTSSSTYSYDLASTEIFTLNLVVSGDESEPKKSKIVYSVNQSLSYENFQSYLDNGITYDKNTTFNPGDIVYVYIISESGGLGSYTFKTTSTEPKEANAEIANIVIADSSTIGDLDKFSFDPSNQTYGTYKVAYGVKTVTFTITKNTNSLKSSFNTTCLIQETTKTVNLTAGTVNNITVGLIAENGDIGKIYTIQIERLAAETYDLLTDLTIDGTAVPKNSSGVYDNIIDVLLPRNSSSAMISYISVKNGESNLAKYRIQDGATTKEGFGFANNVLRINTNGAGKVKEFRIFVYSEEAYEDNGVANEYIVNLYCADEDYTLTNILLEDKLSNNLLDVNGNAFIYDANTKTYSFNVGFTTVYAQLSFTKNNSYSDVSVSGVGVNNNKISELAVGKDKNSNKFTVVIQSEFKKLLFDKNPSSTLAADQTATYVIQINRNEGSDENRLESLVVKNGDNNLTFKETFNPDYPGPYSIEKPELNSGYVEVIAKPMNENAIVKDFKKQSDGTWTKTVSIPNTFSGILNMFDIIDIIVISEVESVKAMPESKPYQVKLTAGTKVESNVELNVDLISISVNDSGSLKYLLGEEINDPEKKYNPGDHSYEFEVFSHITYFNLVVRSNITTSDLKILKNNETHRLGANGYFADQINLTDNVNEFIVENKYNDTIIKYNIKITKNAADSNKDLESWVLTHPTDGLSIDLKDSYINGNDKIYLQPKYMNETLNWTAKVLSPKTLNDTKFLTVTDSITLTTGNNSIQVTVKAQDNSTKTYYINVVVNASLELDSLTLEDGSGTSLNLYKDKNLTDEWTIADINSSKNVNIWVDKSVSVIKYAATLKDALAKFGKASTGNMFDTVLSDPAKLGIGSDTKAALILTLIAIDQEGNEEEYTFNIMRVPGNLEKLITSYTDLGTTTPSLSFDPYKNLYEYRVDSTITAFKNDNYTISDNGTSKFKNVTPGVTAENTILKKGKNTFEISVYSENEPDANPNVYTIVVWQASNNFNVDMINVYDTENGNDLKGYSTTASDYVFNPDTLTYEFKVPYNISTVFFDISKNSSVSVVTINNTNLNEQVLKTDVENIFVIRCLSEYGSLNASATDCYKEYTYKIIREEASNDATLKNLYVVARTTDNKYYEFISGKWITKDELGALPGNDSFEVKVNYAFGSIADNIGVESEKFIGITIKATPNNKNAKVTGINDEKSFAFSNQSMVSWSFTVDVFAEDNKTSKTYTIELSKETLNPDEANSLSKISLAADVEYIEYESTTTNYNVTLPFETKTFVLSAINSPGSNAKIYIDETRGSAIVEDYQPEKANSQIIGDVDVLKNSLKEGEKVIYYIQAESKKGVRGTLYTVTVEFTEGDSDNNLKKIEIDGAELEKFDADTLKYNLRYPYDGPTKTIDIVASLPIDSKATINSGNEQVTLNAGETLTHQIVVTAQNGDIKIYTLEIYYEDANPFFTNIVVDGQKLRDELGKIVEYSSEPNGYDENGSPILKTYYVIVPYSTSVGKITISVPEDNYVTTISSNSTSYSSGIDRVYDNLTFETNGVETVTRFIFTGTAASGKVCQYEIVVTRLGEPSSDTSFTFSDVKGFDGVNGNGTQITDILKDFSINDTTKVYSVPNKVKSLSFNIVPTQQEAGAVVNYYGANNLTSGEENKVVVVITAPDGKTTKTQVFTIYREPMNFIVNEEANEGYKLVSKEDSSVKVASTETIEAGAKVLYYSLDLGKKSVKDIENNEKFFMNFIEYDKTINGIDVDVITDLEDEGTTQVVIKVTDGTENSYVVINLVQEAGPGLLLYVFIIGIIICIIILISILIGVHKEKYGKISSKRKKA